MKILSNYTHKGTKKTFVNLCRKTQTQNEKQKNIFFVTKTMFLTNFVNQKQHLYIIKNIKK